MPRRPLERSGTSRIRAVAPTADATVSIVLAVYDPPPAVLVAQLDAIAGQTSSDWECIAVDDASTDPVVVALLEEWVGLASNRRLIRRPVNGGISVATNDGIDAASGSIVTICDHDDVVHADAVDALVRHFRDHPDHDVVYTDEQLIDADGVVLADYPKPDYSPRRHLGHHYLAHLVAGRRDAIGDIRVQREFEPSQDYDFWLRVIERSEAAGRRVGHIPRVLYSWRAISGSSALDANEKPEMCDAVRRCAQAALDRRGIARTATTVIHDGTPTTSVLLGPLDTVDEPSIDVVRIVAESSVDDVNAAVIASEADVICLLAPDTHPDARDDAEWAMALAVEVLDDGVGAAGPKIVDSNDRLVSIGRVVQPTLDDRLVGEPGDAPGPWGAFFVAREVSALAPAGFTIRRSTFEAAGGLLTGVSIDVAVADLCARLAADGRPAIVRPDVVLRVPADAPPELGSGDQPGVEHEPADGREHQHDIARARGTHPDAWVERFDVLGTSHSAWSEPTVLERLADLLAGGRVDLVTSDVFDTLVTRPAATPGDVFVCLAHRIQLPDHVTPAVFASARRAAERRARQDWSERRRRQLVEGSSDITEAQLIVDPQVAAPEVTLDEIWDRMPATWGDRTVMREAELALESELLQPIPEAVDALRRAKDAGVPVVLVSDIYFTSPQLETVLAAAGVDMSLVDEVVTSADHRLGKAHGLLARIIDGRGVDRDRVAHVGDNEIADAETATKLGAHPVHVEIPWSHHHVDLPPLPIRTWSAASGTDLGISAATRAVLVGAGRFGRDPSFQFGAAVVGPVLTGFTRWVAATTHDLGATHVHCMLREGATIVDLLDATATGRVTEPTPVPIHVSRWVTMRAAVIEATPEELSTALARRSGLTVDHVVRAFDCDPERVRAAFGGDAADPDHIAEAYEALAADSVLRAQIVEHAAELRSRVLTYLRERLVLGDGPLVVADVGWGGTIQEGLTRILRAGGIDHEVIGLYLALSAPGEERLARGARMLSYLPNVTDDAPASVYSRAVAHHADTIERIMTPAIGTLIDVDEAGEPVSRPVDHDPIPPTLQSAQRAMRLVVDRLADRTTGLSDLTDDHWFDSDLRAAFAHLLSDSVTAPSPHLAEALGAWPHDDVAGTSFQSIAGGDLAAATKYATARDVDLLDPHGRSWIAGLAGAVNPSLTAQLAAQQAGVPLDRLAPESESGVARLAAFEVGSDLAEVQIARAVHVAPAGWSVIRLVGDVGSLRSLRFDAGEHAALVQVAHFAVRLTTTRTFDEGTRLVELDDDDLTWVDAHPIDRSRFAHRPGGHLLLDIDPALAPTVRSVEVTVGFRCWNLDDDQRLADTPLARRVSDQTRRISGAIRRRL